MIRIEGTMRLTRIAVITLLGIVTIFAVACGSSATSTPGFETYTDNTNGFSISAPDDWEITQMPAREWVMFRCPSRCTGLNATVAITFVDTAHSSVQDYYTDDLEPAFALDDSNNLISKEDLTIDGIPTIKVLHIFDMPTPYGDVIPLENIECIFIYKQMLWTILMQCDSACWDTYKPTFDTMLDSFQLLD
jgi:hypothetical protein